MAKGGAYGQHGSGRAADAGRDIGPGRGKSKGGPSLDGTSKGPGRNAKGSPRTKNIGNLASYEKTRISPKAMDYVPSAANKAVTGSFFASEPQFRQARDIKEAYRGYKNSPPSGGALRGMSNSEVSKGISSKERSRGR